MEFKTEKIEPSINVLWQNLIALNTSLFKENEENKQQLIETKMKLQTEEKESRKLRSEVEGYQKELMHKNQRINRLTSQLKAVRQLTEELNVDCIEVNPQINPLFFENQSLKTTPLGHNVNEVSNHRKISHLFPNGHIDHETKVKENCDPNIRHVKSAANGLDDQEITDENLLIPLPDQEVHDEHLITPLRKKPKKSKKRNRCNDCDRTFCSNNALKQHHILFHTGERPYVCQQCSSAFARADYLQRHMRTHSNNDHVPCS